MGKSQPPPYSSPAFNQREFYFNNNFSGRSTVFLSKDSHKLYENARKVQPFTRAHQTALSMQQHGIGIPLLEIKITSDLGWYAFAVYRFTPPPAHEHRFFDREKDRYQFCTIVNESTSSVSYCKFRLNFTPDPTDRSKDFVLYVFSHARLPIVDVTPYNGQRLRWVGGQVIGKMYQYELTKLTSKQPSLTDNLERGYKISKSNPLLGNSFKNFFVPLFRSWGKFCGESVACLRNEYRLNPLAIDYPAVCDCNEAILDASVDKNSVLGVLQDTLTYVTMASFFKTLQDASRNTHSRLNMHNMMAMSMMSMNMM